MARVDGMRIRIRLDGEGFDSAKEGFNLFCL